MPMANSPWNGTVLLLWTKRNGSCLTLVQAATQHGGLYLCVDIVIRLDRITNFPHT